MSTNYYATINTCKHCGRHEKIHIGKYSNKSFTSNYSRFTIQEMIAKSDTITDEYGESKTKSEMTSITSVPIKVVDYEFC